MDVETSEAIETLREAIGQVEKRLTAQIVRSEAKIRSELGGELTDLRGSVAALGSSLRLEIAAREDKLRQDMMGMRTELRVHTQMLNESVRDDIRIVAEGVAAIAAKLDAMAR